MEDSPLRALSIWDLGFTDECQPELPEYISAEIYISKVLMDIIILWKDSRNKEW